MRTAMISDAHLQGIDDPAQHRMVAFFDGLEVDHLYILGDIFHWWWGFREAVFSEYVPILAAMHRLRRRGVAITFVPGNHDFAVGPFFDEIGVTVSTRVDVALGGDRYVLVHGDEADDAWGYWLLKTILRGRAFAAVMRAVGPAGARRIGHEICGASREHASDPRPLVAAQKAWAVRQIGAGADVVVVGHSHAPTIEPLAGGTFINLGDFARDGTWLAIGEGPPELRRFTGGDAPARPVRIVEDDAGARGWRAAGK